VNIQDNDGWTPIHAAACWMQPDVSFYRISNNGGKDHNIKQNKTMSCSIFI
jgi:hypothetical protein